MMSVCLWKMKMRLESNRQKIFIKLESGYVNSCDIISVFASTRPAGLPCNFDNELLTLSYQSNVVGSSVLFNGLY